MNEKNLKPIRTESEAREKGRNGGIASGKVRQEKKTIQKILTDYLEKDIKTVKALEKAANAAGITSDASIKELVTTMYLLNSIKKGGLDDLAKLAALIGESAEEQESKLQFTFRVMDLSEEKKEDGDAG